MTATTITNLPRDVLLKEYELALARAAAAEDRLDRLIKFFVAIAGIGATGLFFLFRGLGADDHGATPEGAMVVLLLMITVVGVEVIRIAALLDGARFGYLQSAAQLRADLTAHSDALPAGSAPR